MPCFHIHLRSIFDRGILSAVRFTMGTTRAERAAVQVFADGWSDPHVNASSGAGADLSAMRAERPHEAICAQSAERELQSDATNDNTALRTVESPTNSSRLPFSTEPMVSSDFRDDTVSTVPSSAFQVHSAVSR